MYAGKYIKVTMRKLLEENKKTKKEKKKTLTRRNPTPRSQRI